MDKGSPLIVLLDQMYLTVESYLDQPDFISHANLIDSLIAYGFDLIREIKKTIKNLSGINEMYDRFLYLQQKFLTKCHLENRNILKLRMDTQAVKDGSGNLGAFHDDVHIEQFGWNRSPQKLMELWECFCRRNYIKCEYQYFEKHFYGDIISIEDRLKWRKSARLLARWLFRLKEAGIVQEDTITPTNIRVHFCKKNGGNLNYNTLRAQPGVRMSDKVERDIDSVIKIIN